MGESFSLFHFKHATVVLLLILGHMCMSAAFARVLLDFSVYPDRNFIEVLLLAALSSLVSALFSIIVDDAFRGWGHLLAAHIIAIAGFSGLALLAESTENEPYRYVSIALFLLAHVVCGRMGAMYAGEQRIACNPHTAPDQPAFFMLWHACMSAAALVGNFVQLGNYATWGLLGAALLLHLPCKVLEEKLIKRDVYLVNWFVHKKKINKTREPLRRPPHFFFLRFDRDKLEDTVVANLPPRTELSETEWTPQCRWLMLQFSFLAPASAFLHYTLPFIVKDVLLHCPSDSFPLESHALFHSAAGIAIAVLGIIGFYGSRLAADYGNIGSGKSQPIRQIVLGLTVGVVAVMLALSTVIKVHLDEWERSNAESGIARIHAHYDLFSNATIMTSQSEYTDPHCLRVNQIANRCVLGKKEFAGKGLYRNDSGFKFFEGPYNQTLKMEKHFTNVLSVNLYITRKGSNELLRYMDDMLLEYGTYRFYDRLPDKNMIRPLGQWFEVNSNAFIALRDVLNTQFDGTIDVEYNPSEDRDPPKTPHCQLLQPRVDVIKYGDDDVTTLNATVLLVQTAKVNNITMPTEYSLHHRRSRKELRQIDLKTHKDENPNAKHSLVFNESQPFFFQDVKCMEQSALSDLDCGSGAVFPYDGPSTVHAALFYWKMQNAESCIVITAVKQIPLRRGRSRCPPIDVNAIAVFYAVADALISMGVMDFVFTQAPPGNKMTAQVFLLFFQSGGFLIAAFAHLQSSIVALHVVAFLFVILLICYHASSTNFDEVDFNVLAHVNPKKRGEDEEVEEEGEAKAAQKPNIPSAEPTVGAIRSKEPSPPKQAEEGKKQNKAEKIAEALQ